MFQIGDRVKIKNSTKEYILKEFKNNNESCIILLKFTLVIMNKRKNVYV